MSSVSASTYRDSSSTVGVHAVLRDERRKQGRKAVARSRSRAAAALQAFKQAPRLLCVCARAVTPRARDFSSRG